MIYISFFGMHTEHYDVVLVELGMSFGLHTEDFDVALVELGMSFGLHTKGFIL